MMMPRMNGWEVCDELRKEKRLRSIPVVILTGNMQVKEEDFPGRPVLHKPIRLDELVGAIERYAKPTKARGSA